MFPNSVAINSVKQNFLLFRAHLQTAFKKIKKESSSGPLPKVKIFEIKESKFALQSKGPS